MKILVDSLPYYGEYCAFGDTLQCQCAGTSSCPQTWDKYDICSEDNPHECCFLKEMNEE